MKNLFLALLLFASFLASAAHATPAHPAAAPAKTAALYQCRKCHMKVSAAVAKKDGYKDPMDGGKLVPVPAASKPGIGRKMQPVYLSRKN